MQSAHTIAQNSYSRCLRTPGFFTDFYDRLLASDPAIPPMFAETVFPKQHKLLQHGLGLLLSYANRPDSALLERLAARHSVSGIDVAPGLYDHFIESLIASARTYDPRFGADVESAWREALEPGIEFMRARHAP